MILNKNRYNIKFSVFIPSTMNILLLNEPHNWEFISKQSSFIPKLLFIDFDKIINL